MSLKMQIFIYFPLAHDEFIDKCNGKFFSLNKNIFKQYICLKVV